MKDRPPHKNAIIIFNPGFESAARAFVQENLQYRVSYQNFYMLPVPRNGKKGAPKAEDIKALLKKNAITGANTDSYLIREKNATQWDEDGDECYSEAVLKCATGFKNHFIILTYNYFLGEQKYSTLTRFRQHKRYKTSQGYPQETISQIGLLGSTAKTAHIGRLFFGKEPAYANPPYKYLLLSEMELQVDAQEFDEAERNAYQESIEREMVLRQHKVDPLLRRAEKDYPDPTFVAEKLANLFHAYAHCDLAIRRPTHTELANNIASTLYANPDWELEECLHFIKSCVGSSRKEINPRGTFQGILLEIINMMYYETILQVGDTLNERWQEKYDELDQLKNNLDPERNRCVVKMLNELDKLANKGKPYTVLLRAVESTINVIQHPSKLNFQKQHQIAKEMGKSSAYRKLGGLMLCLLGLSLGIGIGLTIYFTGGAALLAAPLVLSGIMLSATLVNIGVAAIAGTAAATIPFIGAGICLFGKPPIQKTMEKLARREPS